MVNRITVAALGSSALLCMAPIGRAHAQQGANNPHGQLDDPCTACHTADTWKPARVTSAFKHAPKRFPLFAAHAQTKCMRCHHSLDFRQVSSTCAACHQDVHRGELGAECGRCHTERNFLDHSVMQRMHQTTRFPLTGAHLTADCQSCHAPVAQGHLSFVNLPTQCAACHLAAYNATIAPPHAASSFSTQCDQCHITINWSRATYNHAVSGFALSGAHVHVACAQCHLNNVYQGLATTTCVSCHQAQYAGASSPNHAAASFPTTCESCHTTRAWMPSTFNHLAIWSYYTGRHPATACNQCHIGATFLLKGTQCVDCHGNQHGGTDRLQCQNCHNTSRFDN